MKRQFIIAAVTLSLLTAGAVYTGVNASASTPKIQQLVEYINTNQHSMAENLLKDFTNKDKDDFVEYIKANNATLPPLYYIKMADHILKTDKDQAAMWFYIGKVRAYEDVMMCKDKTSQAQLDIYPLFAPKTVKYIYSRNKDKSYMANLLQRVLDWDVNHPNRINPIWACYQGMSAYTKTPELKTDVQRSKVIDNVRDELKESIIKYQKLD